MRGDEQRQEELIMLTSLEDVVPAGHPLRAIRAMVDAALTEMSPTLEALLRRARPPFDRPRGAAPRVSSSRSSCADPLRAAPHRAP